MIDYGKLHERHEHKHCARRHPDIDGLHVRDGRERRLGLSVLGGQGQKTGDSEGDSGWDGFGTDPKRDPGHHDDQGGWDVSVEKVVAETSFQVEDYSKAGEVP